MFDHIQLKVRDLKSSKRFYTAALAPLGFTVEYDDDGLIGFGPKGAPALWLGEGESRGPVHIAFAAKDRAAVRAFYAAAVPAGGTDNGEPGLSPNITPTTTAGS
jgi:catechol 2,3-dioxygenase-like lactoylglutathione lyase family enzyme